MSDFINLKSLRGSQNKFSAICPFHPDKNPSLIVFKDSGRFFCFGCKEKGNSFDFLMKFNNWSFKQARDYLESIYPDLFRQDQFKNLREIKEIWQDEMLRFISDKNLPYFGLSLKTIRERGIGLANQISNSKIFTKFKNEAFREIGLMANDSTKFLFNNRIIFPLPDKSGIVIGFQARTIDEKSNAKYLTVFNSEIFNRDNYIYGEKNLIYKNEVILVEGLKDAYRLEEMGLNPICCLGTNLGLGQFTKIKKFLWGSKNNLIIMFDGDDAGLKSSYNFWIQLDWKLRERVKIAVMPNNMDPAEADQSTIENTIYCARQNFFKGSDKKIWGLPYWDFKNRETWKNKILPRYLSQNLRLNKNSTPLSMPTSLELKMARINAATERMIEWKNFFFLKEGINSNEIKILNLINDSIYRCRLILSVKFN